MKNFRSLTAGIFQPLPPTSPFPEKSVLDRRYATVVMVSMIWLRPSA
jgi:hypothetical protein